MAFIVEDGTAKEDSNSYLTVAEFKTYFTDRGITFTETDPVIQAWLIKATTYAEVTYIYRGQRTSLNQALEFPRYNYYDNRGTTYLSNVIPEYLKNGISELAYVLKTKTTLSPNTIDSGIASKKIGPVSINFRGSSETASPPIYADSLNWFSFLISVQDTELLPI